MGTFHREFDFDVGPQFEDFLEDAKNVVRDFAERLRDLGRDNPTTEFDPLRHGFGCGCGYGPRGFERQRCYPYPPATIYKNREGALVLQFALAGLAESAIRVSFQDDYLVLNAQVPEPENDEERSYERRSFRPRRVDNQKYYVPADDYDQAAASAVFKNGALTVTVPPKGPSEAGGIRIEIVKEGS